MSSYTQNITIIQTKILPPKLASDFVARPFLNKRLEKGLERKLTLVSAPAGYGKSTLLTSWLNNISIPSAWVSLNKMDNDLDLFLHYLIAAVRTLFPDSCNEIYKIIEADNAPIEYIATLLINDISSIADFFILVLDDFHLINDSSVQELIIALIDNQPPNLHLVIASRTDPLLPLPRLRAAGEMNEIRAPDLRFQVNETEIFLNQAMETVIDPEIVKVLNSRTEGWITGLRLIALSATSQETLADILARSSLESPAFVNEYLLSEVLHQLPESTQAFMLHISILDRLSGPLCEAVVAIDESNLNIHEQLSWLNNANIFLVALDDRDEWYRFHHLFQGFLVRELEKIYSEETIKTLHKRASLWFAQQGYTEEAIYHALTAQDVETAITLIEQQSQNLLNSLQRQTLQRWLSYIPQEIIWRRPRLILAKAWLLFREWHLTALKEALNAASEAIEIESISKQEALVLGGQIASLKAITISLSSRNFEKSYQLAEQALAWLPKTAFGARGLAFGSIALSTQAFGDLDMATHSLEAIIYSPSNPEPAKIQCFISLALIYQTAGQLMQLSKLLNQFLLIAREGKHPNAITSANKFSGWLAYEQNDLKKATGHFAETLEYRYQGNFVAVYDASLGLAKSYIARGQVSEAQSTIDNLYNETLRIKNNDLLGPLESFQAYLWLIKGDTILALRWARTVKLETVHESTLYSEVAALTQARILITSGKSEEVLKIIKSLEYKLENALATHFTFRVIQIRTHLALAYKRIGKQENALIELKKAITLAEPGGFIRTFVDMGSSLLPLLKKLNEQGFFPVYLQQIMAAYTLPGFSSENNNGVAAVILTPRQTEILTLLQNGLSYQEISDNLTISFNTVKKHTSNIYEKLGVNNRQQAVRKAKQLNLIA